MCWFISYLCKLYFLGKTTYASYGTHLDTPLGICHQILHDFEIDSYLTKLQDFPFVAFDTHALNFIL
jgi:hypothetical protein